jgi:hypothetical protein
LKFEWGESSLYESSATYILSPFGIYKMLGNSFLAYVTYNVLKLAALEELLDGVVIYSSIKARWEH